MGVLYNILNIFSDTNYKDYMANPHKGSLLKGYRNYITKLKLALISLIKAN